MALTNCVECARQVSTLQAAVKLLKECWNDKAEVMMVRMAEMERNGSRTAKVVVLPPEKKP
jgi:hypothetical protein